MVLDIAILRNLDYLGHFNWESIFWEYPSGILYDPFNALDSIKIKKLNLIIPMGDENPFILASRFLKLCSRFNLDISKDKNLSDLANHLSTAVICWKSEDSFQWNYAREHSYYGLLESILIAKNKIVFLKNLENSKLLRAFFPETKSPLDLKNLNVKRINSLKNMRELIKLFRDCFIDKSKLGTFNQKIKMISKRIG